MVCGNYSICVRLGDQIASVNGISLLDVHHSDAVNILKDSGSNVELVRYIIVPWHCWDRLTNCSRLHATYTCMHTETLSQEPEQILRQSL